MYLYRWTGVFLIVLATAAAAWMGALFEPGNWYEGLQKPAYTPPDFVFPLVWSVLYILMAVAASLVWMTSSSMRRLALSLYGCQLLANAAWSWMFFGQNQIGWALLDLLVLLALVLGCTIFFWRIRPLAGYLFVPYLVWAGFAGLLNLNIWIANG